MSERRGLPCQSFPDFQQAFDRNGEGRAQFLRKKRYAQFLKLPAIIGDFGVVRHGLLPVFFQKPEIGGCRLMPACQLDLVTLRVVAAFVDADAASFQITWKMFEPLQRIVCNERFVDQSRQLLVDIGEGLIMGAD